MSNRTWHRDDSLYVISGIVLGRVVRYEGRKRYSCAFLISWWLDTRTL